MRYIIQFLVLLMWLSGVVLANGALSTVGAVMVPFWALYLVVERLMALLP
jgi:hypothetical protein